MVKLEKLIDGLKSIPDDNFTCDNVYTYLADNPVEVLSIVRYMYWDPNFYTRNLVYKDERFEAMVICWEKGMASRVHDHSGQKCWMTVPVGRLRGQNFAIAEMDESTSLCRLIETDSFDLTDRLAATVELEEPIHQVLNLSEFDQRAVSFHIYSKPYDSCISYCRDSNTYQTVPLFYHSIAGKLCSAS